MFYQRFQNDCYSTLLIFADKVDFRVQLGRYEHGEEEVEYD